MNRPWFSRRDLVPNNWSSSTPANRKWVGGIMFFKIRRGSRTGRAGGENDRGCGCRKTRFFATLMRHLGGGKFCKDDKVMKATKRDRVCPFVA